MEHDYNVGDRIRLLEDTDEGDFKKGSIQTVAKTDNDDECQPVGIWKGSSPARHNSHDGSYSWPQVDEIELVSKDKPTTQFKVGDKVKCIEGGGKGAGWKLNHVFTATESDHNMLWGGIDECGVFMDSLKLVTKAEEVPVYNVGDEVEILGCCNGHGLITGSIHRLKCHDPHHYGSSGDKGHGWTVSEYTVREIDFKLVSKPNKQTEHEVSRPNNKEPRRSISGAAHISSRGQQGATRRRLEGNIACSNAGQASSCRAKISKRVGLNENT